MDSEYLTFTDYLSTSGKTAVVIVGSKSGQYELGTIKWHGPWRTYVLVPAPETVWNKGCLEDVNAYIDKLMAERKEQKEALFREAYGGKVRSDKSAMEVRNHRMARQETN